MASASLITREIFGLKEDVTGNLAHIDENVLVYPAGHNIVVYNGDEKQQKFIYGSDTSEGITAMAVCPSKRFLAVAEKADRGVINIYDLKTLKKRKVLNTSDCQSKQYVSLYFSADNQLLLTQGGAPDWTLVCWNWSKAKMIASIKCQIGGNNHAQLVTQCTFSNVDPAVICCTGYNTLKYYRIVDNSFRPMPAPRVKMRNFKCHTWLKQRDDSVIVGTAAGDLLLFEAGEFLVRLTASPGDGKSVETLVCTRKGLLCGCDDSSVYIYDFVEDASVPPSESIIFIRSVKLDQSTVVNSTGLNLGGASSLGSGISRVHTISVSPSEDALVVALSNAQLLTLPYHIGDMLKQDEIEPLFSLFHRPGDTGQSHITGLDVCFRKPIVATCGLDKTIRIWNYLGGNCELLKQFNEEAHSLSVHPSGLHLLVGFTDKLRLMNILMDDIRVFKEFAIKSCKECQFSNGGHLFAAVNGNTIQVFSTYTCDLLANFRGHNGKVKSLFWNSDDSGLISAGMDGAVYQWDLEDAKREGEFVQKGVLYSSALCNHDGNIVYAAGSDRFLKEIEFPASQVTKELDTDKMLGQLVISHSQRLLFAATAELDRPGSVRIYKFPLTGDFVEYPCLSSPVTRMRISHDDTNLFVAGEDGTLCIFDIREKEGRARIREGRELSKGFAEEILVTKSDLEEKNIIMQELKSKVDELTLHNEYQMRLKDMNYNESIKEVTEKFTHELEQDKSKYELLREEKNDMEMEYEERIKQLDEKHQQKLQELEATYQQRIIKEVEAYQEVLQQREQQKARWEEEQSTLVSTHERYVSEVTEDFEQRLDEDRQLRMQMEDEKDQLTQEYVETKRQLEEDIDQEIEALKLKYENKLSAEREATLRYKGENGIMKKKFSALQKDIEDQREDVKTLLEKEKELYEQIKTLEKEIQAHKREIRARDETIGEKEKRIYDLKKKNQELEKFKFVLDYKIKELKRQIEPRENEISDMREQIKEMDHELEQFHKSNAQLDLMIGELRSRLDSMQKDIVKNRKRLGDQQSLLRRFRCDLHDIVQHIQDPHVLQEKVQGMMKKYVKFDVATNKADAGVNQEYNRQKEFLEKSVFSLKQKYAKDIAVHREENLGIMSKNMTLIKEINDLRTSLVNLKANVQATRASINLGHMRGNNTREVDTTFPDQAEDIILKQAQSISNLTDSIQKLEGKLDTDTSVGVLS